MTTTTAPQHDELKTLSRLKVSPRIAWPTVTLMVLSHGANILSWVMVLNGLWPAWVGLVINSIAGYVMFTPAHEAIHRCAARKPEHNDLVLAIATFVAVPFGKGKMFRLMHMRHHRFANDPQKDPDHWMASSLWTMPLWGFWPFLYLINFLRNPQVLPNVKPAEIWRELAVAGVALTALFLWKPYEAMMLWLIPSYFSFYLMCLVFMVLPHYPHTGRQDVDPNTTALMRMGKEWLLTPVLMYQNYHLIHHLYPTIPFYRYGKAWKAREQYHRAHSGSMIIRPFQLGPDDKPGNA
ncbi:MAG: fatty acid desaturase [Alcanivorax sp.]|jgi:fatty acid desaturase|uniref:fatty acid desaturase n=1 Tax=Alcanivorax sp. TaxID=1872427 RepID=UPI002622880E|nr:fatty acid desaturase [Alcanivorax sp.]MDF1725629.1 fatty acid desaturase [Alcanivorax sp.]